jgi:hypothetical protein
MKNECRFDHHAEDSCREAPGGDAGNETREYPSKMVSGLFESGVARHPLLARLELCFDAEHPFEHAGGILVFHKGGFP